MREPKAGDLVQVSESSVGRVTRVEGGFARGFYVEGAPDIGGGCTITGWSRPLKAIRIIGNE